jgi:hypothetical protein
MPPSRPLRLLRISAVLVAAGGVLSAVWLGAQVVLHPAQARQFGKYGDAVPYWIPLALFVGAGMLGCGYVFWRAAQRVTAGEDLHANSFRKKPERPKR